MQKERGFVLFSIGKPSPLARLIEMEVLKIDS